MTDKNSEMPPLMGSQWMISVPANHMDTSTSDYEYIPYRCADVSGTTYRLWTTNTSAYQYLPHSMLEVNFQVKTNGEALDESDSMALNSNGWSLFENVKCKLSDELIGQVSKPGKMSHVRNMSEFSKEYMDRVGEKSHHYLDTVSDAILPATVARNLYVDTDVDTEWKPTGMLDELQALYTDTAKVVSAIRANPDFDPAMKKKVARSTTSQSIFLPVSEIFPLFGHPKVLIGTRIELELNKVSAVSEACFGSNDTTLSIDINNLTLWIANLKPSLKANQLVTKQISESPVSTVLYDNIQMYSRYNNPNDAGQVNFLLSHKQQRPSHAYVFFQKSTRDSDAGLNSLQFDRLGGKLNRLEFRINGRQVPARAYDLSSSTGLFPSIPSDASRIVHEIHRVSGKAQDYADSACINYEQWAKVHPYVAFDLSFIESSSYDTLSTAEVEVVWNLSAAPDYTYNCHVVLVSSAQLQLDYSKGITSIRLN